MIIGVSIHESEAMEVAFYQPWSKTELRDQAAVVKGIQQPTKVLSKGIVLNVHTKRWEQANIWIYQDRIIYVGDRLPRDLEQVEVTDCSGNYLVPGYIEPHAHPFQLYNPSTLAAYGAMGGTTTFVSDNLIFYMLLSEEHSFDIIRQLNETPTSFFWWCRYDAQTKLQASIYSEDRIRRWLDHPNVIQGGELTSWPQVLHGDDQLLEWMQITKQHGKRIEGHLPGASERTLIQMQLLGVDCDHEAMTAEEAWMRLSIGMTTSLRYSSIRPDLPVILKGLLEQGLENYQSLYMTTDGSTPHFYEQGIMDRTIGIALAQGVPVIEAYLMASHNVAVHYGLQHLIGSLAPGRIAHINILSSKEQPTPISVLAKGEWVKKQHYTYYPPSAIDFKKELGTLDIGWELTEDMLSPKTTIGINMTNAVITESLELKNLPDEEQLPEDVAYLTLMDVHGKWKVSTFVKGFAKIDGFASSFSSTGDLLLIGRKKASIVKAFRRLKEINGGIILVEKESCLAELMLPIRGWQSEQPMELLAQEELHLTSQLRDRGYAFADPIYSLLFFSSTHLPYIRITQLGLVDVMRNQVVHPVEYLT